MAESTQDVEKQLKKEKKEKEKQQREKEKREKKLEKERKKQEAKDQKQREKEAKQKTQDGASPHKAESTEEPSKNIEELPQNGVSLKADEYGSPEPTTDVHLQLPNGTEPPAASQSSPEEVTVAEPPGQISDFGQPISILFDTARAGKGPLTASCTGAKIGNVLTIATEVREGIYSVRFTPDVADMYVLSVRWGGKEVNGSPFNINLNRLSPATPETENGIEVAPETEKEAAKEREEGIEAEAAKETQQEGQGGKEEEEEEVEVSDDPFEMAIQARKLLEKQRHVQQISPRLDPPTTPSPNPSPHQPMANEMAHPVEQGTSSLPYPSDASLSPMPRPLITPAREEDVRYLHEVNKTLQGTNQELGEEVAVLKKKMDEFEAKLSAIEKSTQIAEEEKKELMAHINVRGWLYKRGIKGPTANVWRPRYFRCDQGSKIYYYKSAADPMPRGYIDLEKVESVEEVSEPQSESGNRAGFHVVCGERTFEMEADNDETRKRWISAIKYLKKWHQDNPDLS